MPLPRAYHFPRQCRPPTRSQAFGDVEVAVAHPARADWQATVKALGEAHRRLRRRSLDDVLAALQRAFDDWHAVDSPQRHVAEATLPAITGFSAAMIRHGLPQVLAPLHADSVRELLATEMARTARRTPIAPGLITHVLAGNIPGLGAVAMQLSLAIGSAAILKTAAGDPLSAALWAQSIAHADAELGDCLAVTYWPGGEVDVEAEVFAAADLVVASGSDTAIAAIAAHRPRRFCGHGHRISIAAIGREALQSPASAATAARSLARDITMWDQQGCLSPQVCYVEAGAAVAPLDFAAMLADALARDAADLPPRRLSLDEQAAVLRFRQEAEWAADSTLLASVGSTAWSIAVEPGASLQPTCLNRCLRLHVVARIEEVAPILSQRRQVLEAAGLAIGEARWNDVARMLGECGVHRVCPLGTMQQPPLSWCPGGRPRIGDWIEWMEHDARNI